MLAEVKPITGEQRPARLKMENYSSHIALLAVTQPHDREHYLSPSLSRRLSICWHPLLLMTRVIRSQLASHNLGRICLQFSRKSLMSAQSNFLICHTTLHLDLFKKKYTQRAQ